MNSLSKTSLAFSATLLLLQACSGKQNPAVQSAQNAAQRDPRILLTDGKGHYVAASRPAVRKEGSEDPNEDLYYGDGKDFYLQRVFGSGGTSPWEGPSYSAGQKVESYEREYTIWSPQVDPRDQSGKSNLLYYYANITITGKPLYKVTCGYKETELNEVPEAQAAPILSAATFHPMLPHTRVPFFLGRDENGQYYYVDRLTKALGAKGHRVFIGKRGALKEKPLVNIVDDAMGTIFSTKSGKLKLATGAAEAVWIHGKKVPLVVLDIAGNDTQSLIYTELGVYEERLGTPCDDM